MRRRRLDRFFFSFFFLFSFLVLSSRADGSRDVVQSVISFIEYCNLIASEYPRSCFARCNDDLRIDENLGFPSNRLFFSLALPPRPRGPLRSRSRGLKSSTVAPILECNELAVIDVSRARLPPVRAWLGRFFSVSFFFRFFFFFRFLFSYSLLRRPLPYITLAAVSCWIIANRRRFRLLKFARVTGAEDSFRAIHLALGDECCRLHIYLSLSTFFSFTLFPPRFTPLHVDLVCWLTIRRCVMSLYARLSHDSVSARSDRPTARQASSFSQLRQNSLRTSSQTRARSSIIFERRLADHRSSRQRSTSRGRIRAETESGVSRRRHRRPDEATFVDLCGRDGCSSSVDTR